MSANTEKFGSLPKKGEASKATPGALKIAVKSCSGLLNCDSVGRSDPYCIVYNPSGIEVLRTPAVDNDVNPEFPGGESKANMMFHNEHGCVRIVVKDKDTIRDEVLGVVYLPVSELLARESGVLTAPLGTADEGKVAEKSAKGPAVFDPFREVKGEPAVKAGYVTIQYQFSAGTTVKEPSGTKPAEPFKKKSEKVTGDVPASEKDKKEKKEKKGGKTPDPSSAGDAQQVDNNQAVPTDAITVRDCSALLATLPGVQERPILRVDSIVAAVPALGEAQLYFADHFQFAADPINGRNTKVASVLFVTRTHLYLVDASAQSPYRCIPLQDITTILTKGEKVCVKCSVQHDCYGELSSADSAKSLGAVVSGLASSLGGGVALGDLKEIKSHQWAPRDGYALAVAVVPSLKMSGGSAGSGEKERAEPKDGTEKDEKKEKKEKKSKTPALPVEPAAEAPATVAEAPALVPEVPVSAPEVSVVPSQPMRVPLSLRDRFERYCARYIPDRLPSLDSVLLSHKGREEELMAQLVRTYGPEPEDEGPPALDPANPLVGRVTRFFAKYQPSRMVEAPYLAKQYTGREEELLSGLVFVYGPEPVEGDTAVATSALLRPVAEGGVRSGGDVGLHSSAGHIGEGERPTSLLRIDFPFTQPAPMGSETNYVRPQQGVVAMMPSLNFAAVLWAGHVAYHLFGSDSAVPPSIQVRVGILSRTHMYIGSDFHYERCVPIRLIERFYLRAKLRSNSTHVRISAIVKLKAPEPDCCFEFSDQQDAERMISMVMRLAMVSNPHHAIDTAPFESAQDPTFNLALPEGYQPRMVEPLPLLPEYEPIMGRYRQRLIDIYQRSAIDKMENVDRVLYMFPHEEEKMVQKLQDAYGSAAGDCDSSDIIGMAQYRHAHAQRSSKGGAFPPPFLDAPEREPLSRSRFYDPSPVRSAAPTVGRYTVGAPAAVHPNASVSHAAAVDVSHAMSPKAYSYSPASPKGAGTAPDHQRLTVADLLKAQGFSILSFNRACRESSNRQFTSVTAASPEDGVLRDVRFKLEQCGEDETHFLDMIRGGPPATRADLSFSRSPFSPTAGVRSPNAMSGPSAWAPQMEVLESSSAGAGMSSSRYEGGASRPNLPMSATGGRAPLPSPHVTQQHPLWPYL